MLFYCSVVSCVGVVREFLCVKALVILLSGLGGAGPCGVCCFWAEGAVFGCVSVCVLSVAMSVFCGVSRSCSGKRALGNFDRSARRSFTILQFPI